MNNEYYLVAGAILAFIVIVYLTMKKTVEKLEVEPATKAVEPAPVMKMEVVKPSELLPVPEKVADFDSKNPKASPEVEGQNFLVAGYGTGINTIGSSLKNANLQLRSDPYIPRLDIGPWNQSTITSSDLTNRKQLEIGSNM